MRTDKLFGKPGWVGWGRAYYAVDLSPPSERGSVPFMPWEPCQTSATVDYSIDLQPSSLQVSIFFLMSHFDCRLREGWNDHCWSI